MDISACIYPAVTQSWLDTNIEKKHHKKIIVNKKHRKKTIL